MTNLLTALTDRDETFLTGVRYSEAGYATASPYIVRDADHWAFAGLNVRNGTLFGQHSLVSDANSGFAAADYDPLVLRMNVPDCQVMEHRFRGRPTNPTSPSRVRPHR